MTCSSAMASRSVLPPRSPRGAFLPTRSGPVPFSMPLGLILGRPFTPLSWATSARSSAIACCSAAFSASRRSARVSSSPRGRPEREIVLGADMPGEIESNSVPHNPSAHPSPDFCPSYRLDECGMADATGETNKPLRVTFDRRLKLEFHGARITSDGGLIAYRELDDALGLTATAASTLAEGRRGTNIRHRLPGLLRQAVYGRLAGYEDVNDAERLARDPAMRAIVGREGLDQLAASTSQMGRFETEWLATEANLAALADLSGNWIDRIHERRPP